MLFIQEPKLFLNLSNTAETASASYLALLDDVTSSKDGVPNPKLLTKPSSQIVDMKNNCVFNNNKYQVLRFEVTNAQFYDFVQKNTAWTKKRIAPQYHDGNYLRHWRQGQPPYGGEYHPVVYVSWYAADAYCRWRGGRLPSREEWMATAGCGYDSRSPKKYPWGNEFDKNLCNVGFEVGTTVPVGYYPGSSDTGAYDMCGNVWEWTASKKDRYYFLKGGSWGGYRKVDAEIQNDYLSVAQRTGNHIGFRCAWEVPEEERRIP